MARARSRREEYSEATREGLVDSALTLFAERGYTRTSLDDVVAATRVTKGALYHHFASKQALFEAAYDRLGHRMQQRVKAAAAEAGADGGTPWDAAMAGTEAFLDFCCEPPYARMVMQEAPIALGYARWRHCEEQYAYGIIQGFLEALVATGTIDPVPLQSATQLTFAMFGGAALALAEAQDDDKAQVRDEVAVLMRRFLGALRP